MCTMWRKHHHEGLALGGPLEVFPPGLGDQARFALPLRASGVNCFSLGLCITEPMLGCSCVCLLPAILGWGLCRKHSPGTQIL